jgi:hypothetical protein
MRKYMPMADTRDFWSKVQVLTSLIAALGGVAIPVTLFLVGNRFSERQRSAAEKQLQADRVERMLAHLASEKSDEKKLAVRILEFFVSEQQFPGELLPAVMEIASSDAKEDVAASATRVLQKAAQSREPQIAKEAQRGLSALPPRINVHPTPAWDERKTKGALFDLSHGDVVVAPQAPVHDPPKETQLRYYRQEDAAQAQEMVTRLSERGIQAVATDLSHSSAQEAVRPRSFDLIIGKQ